MDKTDRFRDVKKLTAGGNLYRIPRITYGGGAVTAIGFSVSDFKQMGERTGQTKAFYEAESMDGGPIPPPAHLKKE